MVAAVAAVVVQGSHSTNTGTVCGTAATATTTTFSVAAQCALGAESGEPRFFFNSPGMGSGYAKKPFTGSNCSHSVMSRGLGFFRCRSRVPKGSRLSSMVYLGWGGGMKGRKQEHSCFVGRWVARLDEAGWTKE